MKIIGVDYSSGGDYSIKTIPDGVECGHRGCSNHMTHPCEGCGRVRAQGIAQMELQKERK